MTKIYGYDTNVYEISIGNIKKDESYITTDEITYSMLVQKIEQLQSNWNSLKEWLFSEYLKKQHTNENNLIRISLLLNKMNELEGNDKK